jgi:hypothetical protein
VSLCLRVLILKSKKTIDYIMNLFNSYITTAEIRNQLDLAARISDAKIDAFANQVYVVLAGYGLPLYYGTGANITEVKTLQELSSVNADWAYHTVEGNCILKTSYPITDIISITDVTTGASQSIGVETSFWEPYSRRVKLYGSQAINIFNGYKHRITRDDINGNIWGPTTAWFINGKYQIVYKSELPTSAKPTILAIISILYAMFGLNIPGASLDGVRLWKADDTTKGWGAQGGINMINITKRVPQIQALLEPYLSN